MSSAAKSSPPRIGLLYSGDATPPSYGAVLRGLEDFGLRDGRDIVIEHQLAHGDFERLPALARDLVARPVALIVAVAGDALSAARSATRTVPIVSATAGGNFVAMGLIASWSNPGGNITGMNLDVDEAIRHRVDLLHRILPTARTVGVLVHARNPESPGLLAVLESAAAAERLALATFNVGQADELEARIAEARAAGVDALMTLQGPFFFSNKSRIAEACARQALPLAMGESLAASFGALLQVNPDIPGCARRSAWYVDRILKGADPGALAIERFSRTEVVLNLQVARRLGLKVDARAIPEAAVMG